LTEQNRTSLTMPQNMQHIASLSEVFRYLSAAGLLDNQEGQANFTTVLHNARFAHFLAAALGHLIYAHPSILDQQNLTSLLQQAQYSCWLAIGLRYLSNVDRLGQVNFNILIVNPERAIDQAMGIIAAIHPPAQAYPHGLFANQGAVPQINYVNEGRLTTVRFPSDLIPRKYLCELSMIIMDVPVKLPETKQICNRATLDTALALGQGENPFNRQPMLIDEVVAESELKHEIHAYVDLIVEAVNTKKQQLQQEVPPRDNLTYNEYKAIDEAANNALAFRNLPNSYLP
jgi:hypothetical protein